MSTVRLYGRDLGQGSHVQVTRGFETALKEQGLWAGTLTLDDDASDEIAPGASAPDAIFTGPLNMTAVMLRNTCHERRFTMVAPNSNKLPPALLNAIVQNSTAVLAPSEWAASVVRQQLQEYAFPERHVFVVPHGLDPEFHPIYDAVETSLLAAREGTRVLPGSYRHRLKHALDLDEFRVLHLSTSDRQRKGTRELILAWQSLWGQLPSRAELALVLDPMAGSALRAWLVDENIRLPKNVRLVDRLDLPPAELRRLYNSSHVVCQPSRGEAFGLVPLEATASGVPVVATECTGHAQYMQSPEWLAAREQGRSGVVVIEHGPDAPIDDWPGARDPSVEPSAIAVGLRYAYKNWQHLDEQAGVFGDAVATNWTWSAQLRPFLTTELRR